MTEADIEAVARRAVQLYAEAHPRPSSVTQDQAAEMAGVSRMTIHRMLKGNKLKLNAFGRIPTADLDKAITGA